MTLFGSLRELSLAGVPADELAHNGSPVVETGRFGCRAEVVPQVLFHSDRALRGLPFRGRHGKTVTRACPMPQRCRVNGVSRGCGHVVDRINLDYPTTTPCTGDGVALKWSLQHGTPPPAPGSNRDGVPDNSPSTGVAVSTLLVATKNAQGINYAPTCDAHRVSATFAIEFEDLDGEGRRELFCTACVGAGMEYALTRAWFTPPTVSRITVPTPLAWRCAKCDGDPDTCPVVNGRCVREVAA